MTKSVNQLINFFRPEGYLLSIEAIPGKREFKGQVFIAGNKTGKFVRLHAKGLTFKNVKVNAEPAEVIECANDEIELRPVKHSKLDVDYGADLQERWGVSCDTSVAIEFSGKISDNGMHGLYPCYYQVDGQDQELLATQFESHHAREVFPCVDEPAAKAKFLCQVTTDSAYQALSNMPVDVEIVFDEDSINKRRATFQMTPKMSTYLLAFVIGKLHRKTAKTASGVEVNIYATPAQPASSLDFALDTAVKCIDFYDDYFGIKYPLPKSDHIALPDFSSGAMENWGLITYREVALLADKSTGVAAKQYIATVIAHELSHQWFGNLTTMKWWNDLWLNESFASLMEHIATDALFPDWQMWQTFETLDVVAALRRDSLPGVQPVRQDIQHPDEISTLFDSAIVYAKGERLLKMLRAFIGEANFRSGLKDYFQKFAYDNTTAEDLWQCLSIAAGRDVAALMNPWLTRPGYPLVRASLSGNEITLRQQRFLNDGTTDDQIWPIPLFASSPEAPEIMETAEVTFTVKDPQLFRLNVDNNAHFITVQDEQLSEYINRQVPDMSPTDRAKLLNEALLLVQPGVEPTANILDLLESYSHEDNDAVWDVMAMALGAIGRFVELDSDDERRLRQLCGTLSKGQYKRLGWKAADDESINDRRLRPTILGEMIFAEDQSAIDTALGIYSQLKHSLDKLDGDQRTIILGAAVRYGEPEEFDYLLAQYKISHNAELKEDIATALTSTRDQDRIDEILDLMDRSDIVKPQDLFSWYVSMLRNRRARSKTWGWLVDHWTWIDQTFSGDKSYDLFPRCAGQILDNQVDLANYQDFFGSKTAEPALKRAIEIGLNDISARVAWIDRDQAAVLDKLRSKK